MKLCRFQLSSSPDEVRSGIMYGGKVYETDGVSAIAIHEVASVTPLAPIGHPPSVRVFTFSASLPAEVGDPLHSYANPAVVFGPSREMDIPGFTASVDILPCLGVVLGQPARQVSSAAAESCILGYTPAMLFVALDVEGDEKQVHSGPGRSRDVGIAIGPVVTTPDELDDTVIDASDGRRYKLATSVRINGVEKFRGEVAGLPFTPGRAVGAASESAPLASGDLILLGPISESVGATHLLEPGDEIQLQVERLGVLLTKIAP